MFSYQSSYSWRQALLSVITGDNNILSKIVEGTERDMMYSMAHQIILCHVITFILPPPTFHMQFQTCFIRGGNYSIPNPIINIDTCIIWIPIMAYVSDEKIMPVTKHRIEKHCKLNQDS